MVNKLLLKDSSGKKSVTMTAFVLGFIVVNAKLFFSGFTIGDYTVSNFSGVDYGASLAALGAIYVMRRNGKEEVKKDGSN